MQLYHLFFVSFWSAEVQESKIDSNLVSIMDEDSLALALESMHELWYILAFLRISSSSEELASEFLPSLVFPSHAKSMSCNNWLKLISDRYIIIKMSKETIKRKMIDSNAFQTSKISQNKYLMIPFIFSIAFFCSTSLLVIIFTCTALIRLLIRSKVLRISSQSISDKPILFVQILSSSNPIRI